MATQPVQTGGTPVQERLRQNIMWCAEQRKIGLKRLAGMADIAIQTLRNWLNGTASPTLVKLDDLAEVIGIDPAYLVLEHEEMVERVTREGFRPFVLSPVPTSSPSGRTPSGATVGSPVRRHWSEKDAA